MSRRGRRPGESGTRAAILDGARRSFAERGFDRTTIRAVAAGAGVDPALVHHYFGTKRELFLASVDLPAGPVLALRSTLGGSRRQVGARLAAAVFELWDRPDFRDGFASLLRAALTDEAAAATLREAISATTVRIVADELGLADLPEAALRTELAGSHLVGLFLARHVLRIEPLASAPAEVVVAAVAPTIQRYLLGDLGSPTLPPPGKGRRTRSAAGHPVLKAERPGRKNS